MKSSLLFIAVILLILSAGRITAESVDTAWVRTYNGPSSDEDRAYGVTVDNFGDIYVTGYRVQSGYSDFHTRKYRANGDFVWSHTYNGTASLEDIPRYITLDNDNNVFVTGGSRGSGTHWDYLTIKYDSSGNVIYTKRYSGPGNYADTSWCVLTDSDGNAYVTGSVAVSGTDRNVVTIKYLPNGDTAWVRSVGGAANGQDQGFSLAADSAGAIYVAGTCYDGALTGTNALLIKYLPSGDTVWTRKYNGAANGNDIGRAICTDAKTNIYFLASSQGSGTGWDAVIIKYDSSGNEMWTQIYNGPINGDDISRTIGIDQDNNVIITGYSVQSEADYDCIIVKYSEDGDSLWTAVFDGVSGGDDFPATYTRRSNVDDNGNIYLVGYGPGPSGNIDIFASKYDPSGTLIWNTTYNGTNNGIDNSYDYAMDSNGNLIVVGRTFVSGTVNYDYCIIKYVPAFEVVSVSPLPNTLNSPVSCDIDVTFGAGINPASIDESSFIVSGNYSGLHSGTINIDALSNTATYNPDIDFEPGEIVTVTLTRAIESESSLLLIKPYVWQFATIAEKGTGMFEPSAAYPFGDSTGTIYCGDMDNDGDIDVLMNDFGNDQVCLFKNEGDGILGPYSTIPVGDRPRSVQGVDLDADGDLDIITANNNTNTVSVLKNNGDGTFSGRVDYVVGTGPNAAFCGDLDGDGDADIVAVNGTTDNFSILKNNGSGSFSAKVDYACGDGPVWLCLGDLDNDYDLDITIVSFNDDDISVFLNNGNATSFSRTDYPVGDGPYCIDNIDLNGDNYLDLVVTNYVGNSISIILNNGDGTFAPQVNYNHPGGPSWFTYGDIDYDGDIDLIINSEFSIMLNDGDGSFVTLPLDESYSNVSNPFAVDIDGDGDVDIIANHPGILLMKRNINGIYVTNDGDGIPGSLSAAIDNANSDMHYNIIFFDDDFNIQLTSPLPQIVNNGTFLAGSSAPNGAHSVVLDGSALGKSSNAGFQIHSSYNLIEGLTIRNFSGNGIEITGTTQYNKISNNLIYNNGLLGIDLGDDGVTLNDPDDGDTGPNDFLNYPEIDSVFMNPDSSFRVFGRAANDGIIEFFVAYPAGDDTKPADPSGHGEAWSYIGSDTADGSGNFEYEISNAIAYFSLITTTCTDALGNTSEFSPNFRLVPSPLIIVGYSPINLHVIDPAGDSIGKYPNDDYFNTIGSNATYEDIIRDSITIQYPLEGEYIIIVYPQGDPPSGALYTIGIRIDGSQQAIIVENINVPATGTADTLGYEVIESYHFFNGDASRDDNVNLIDILYLIAYLYNSPPGPAPYPLTAGDANCDQTINLIDILYLIDHLYNTPPGSEPCHWEDYE